MIGLSRWPPRPAPLHTAQRTNKVEILKFAEPPKRSSRTSTQKRGGLMPLLAVVVSVAVVGGMSTTLAGTISLNTSGSVEFGQGVVTTAACDTTIKIIPESEFDSSSAEVPFYVKSIELQDIGISGGSDTATYGGGCLGKRLTLRAYDAAGLPLNIKTGGITSIFVEIPDSSTTSTAPVSHLDYNVKENFQKTDGVLVLSAGGFGGNTQASGEGLAGRIKLGSLTIPGSVTKITLESSEPQ